MYSLIALFLLTGAVNHGGNPAAIGAEYQGLQIDSLGITAKAGTKWYSYTNKVAGFYFGEVRGPNDAPYQGWTVYNDPVLKDYSISVNGKELDRSDSKVTVYPDRLVRKYPSGVTETFTLLDEVNTFVVGLQADSISDIDFRVLFDASGSKHFALSGGGTAYVLEDSSVAANSYGRWVGIGADFVKARTESGMVGHFRSPVSFHVRGKSASFAVSCGKTRLDAIRAAFALLRARGRFEEARKQRMQKILDDSYVATNDKKFDKALAWAKLSLDALITDQGMKGIWAGLPWFNNYWGRDSFISLAGATLWLGNFKAARKILLDFAAKQELDSSSTNYGRIPNLITPASTIYNTADGTPCFVFAAYEYFVDTGDRRFLYDVYPAVKRALYGTLKYHTDKEFFLTHGNQETWMDAVGPKGPYTPRGNRAVEVEAYWLRQVLVTRLLAQYVGDAATSDLAVEIAKNLQSNFNKKFVDSKSDLLYDHLSAKGVPDTTLRPNQLMALWAVRNSKVQANILRTVVEKLDYPWGLASLYQGDPNFHPFHHDEPYYPPDAAYHNGTVWVWLTGPLVSELVSMREAGFAFKNTEFLVNQILDGKTAGTLPELFDAFPHEGERVPDESGAFSQAWSLAEFVGSFYRDYLGIQMDAFKNTVTLNPRLPDALSDVTFNLHAGNGERYRISYKFDESPKEIEIVPSDSVPGTTFRIFMMLDKERQIRTAFYLSGKSRYLLKISPDTVVAEKDGTPFQIDDLSTLIPHDSSLDSLHFQTPGRNPRWKFMEEKQQKAMDMKK